jgi:hypothetical protein
MLLTAALLITTGCSLLDPTAAPVEPFGAFIVGEFGGIDGRQTSCEYAPTGWHC